MSVIEDIKACAVEVERQQDTPMHVAYLYEALLDARWMLQDTTTQNSIICIWHVLENGTQPSSSLPLNSYYRKTPVVFNQGMPAIDASLISTAMYNLIKYQDMLSADEFTKEFLLIHPFHDGNGRLSWLLFNWKNNTLDNPIPLPRFEFS